MLQVMGKPENKICYLFFLKQNKLHPPTSSALNLLHMFRTDSVLIKNF